MRPLNVLFLSSDDLVAQVRLLPMLEILQASGRITFVVVDRDLNVTGRANGPFDVCLAHRNPGKRQIGWLRGRNLPLLYDIDDFLLSGSDGGVVRWSLEHAAVVTAPARRLLATLDAAMGGRLADRLEWLPNAGRESPPAGAHSIGKPKLIWISSALPQAGDELTGICEGIADAARKLSADMLLVGRFPPAIVAALPRGEHVAWVPPPQLLDWIAGRPLIAVAPLSTDLDTSRQQFADCKSDIKIAQYGSSGIAGVYSKAPPYVESDLPRRLVRANDATSWSDEIMETAGRFAEEGAALAGDAAFARRRPSVLASQLFDLLERAAAAGRPFAFRAIATPRIARVVEKRIRSWLR